MRQIVLDTETTGFDAEGDDRIVEIGCIELVNYIPTGKEFHAYLNPERDMPDSAYQVHKLSADFLSDKPLFKDRVDDFLAFIGDTPLVIHNASFDMKFLNAELKRVKKPTLPWSQAIDTLALARRKFPGAPNSLDALCKRFGIDSSSRADGHGAIVDSLILAEVYLELVGGRQAGLELAHQQVNVSRAAGTERAIKPARPHTASEDELARHKAFLEKLKDPIWLRS